MKPEEKKYWLAFNVFAGIGPARFKSILAYFGSAKKAFFAKRGEWLKSKILGEKLTDKFLKFRTRFELEEYLKKLKELHVGVLTLKEKNYPHLLAQISDPPFILYVRGRKGDKRGNEEKWDIERSMAVVGTRQVTTYGRQVTWRITQDLVAEGFTVVSGLALGVDAIAHKAAIEAGGKTIAVLGCGVDLPRPLTNIKLYDQIIDGGGAVVSEIPLGITTTKGIFPARNRIISGLSLGVVVTEGAFDSGSLITARYAAEQGREVFAIPGPVTSRFSKAPSRLIKQGAKLCENVSDILEELNLEAREKKDKRDKEGKARELTKEEEKVFNLLKGESLHIDEITRQLNMRSAEVSSLLSIMEIKGIIKSLGRGEYGTAD